MEMIYRREYNIKFFLHGDHFLFCINCIGAIQERLRYGNGPTVPDWSYVTYIIEGKSGCGSGTYGIFITEGKSGWGSGSYGTGNNCISYCKGKSTCGSGSVAKNPNGAYRYLLICNAEPGSKCLNTDKIALYFEKSIKNIIKNASY